jgi:2-hydroxy-3-keto-5-methylthiopentenyl-1-phosphate phosphatase
MNKMNNEQILKHISTLLQELGEKGTIENISISVDVVSGNEVHTRWNTIENRELSSFGHCDHPKYDHVFEDDDSHWSHHTSLHHR